MLESNKNRALKCRVVFEEDNEVLKARLRVGGRRP